ncbi:sensor histidine kinase [Dyadobacter sp. CY326]|uniref:sensor histidine kinase n=1 Tax=Dyadobacter sp. CY326 TaxID=2907300 RepID=UPI001F1AE203|nr:histidine kinase [Dyadobacter sp. CY326]MCE7067456.1 histidine kinase [Dyadobacter sp. CY326]
MMQLRFSFFEKYFDAMRKNRLNFFILVLVLPWLVPVVGYLMWGSIYFSDMKVFLGGSFINLILCLIANHINQIIAIYIAKIYPDTHQSVLRVIFWFILYAIVNVIILFVVLFAYDKMGLFGFSMQRERVLWSVFTLLAASLIGAGLTELAYAFMQWKTNQDELQQMEQKQLLSELEVVKQQVNPHFLFNCLNSLSVLISESPAIAEKFVDEMSKVYRYLLSVNGPDREMSMVTLDAELRYIRSYIYLLETRFENGISISIQVADLYLTGQMAPLTLQTLIDNAIRHNIIAADHPLLIQIRTTATGQLEVRNNLQKRTVRTPFTTNGGLATLMSRYKMLFNQAGTIQIKEENSEFTVLLPLIYT